MRRIFYQGDEVIPEIRAGIETVVGPIEIDFYDSDDLPLITAADQDDDNYTVAQNDCNDFDATIHPNAEDLCNDEIDQDCNPATCAPTTWYFDADQDGFGIPSVTIYRVLKPDGYVSDSSHCNDQDEAIHPGVADLCGDGVDQDCDPHACKIEMPSLIYISQAEAESTIRSIEMVVGSVSFEPTDNALVGKVLRQEPPVGTQIHYGHTVNLVVGRNPVITATVGSGGIIKPSGAVEVTYGDQQSFAITAKSGYFLAKLIVDDQEYPLTSTYTFENVSFDHTVEALFKVVWFVNGARSTSGNGRSWKTAFRTIQEAVNAAGNGDMIWVSTGQYDISEQIDIRKSLDLYGGFSGSETRFDQRDISLNKSIVNALDSRCVYINGQSTNAIIDGFTIQNGHVDNDNSSTTAGGGILIELATTTVRNCKMLTTQ